MEQTNNYYDQFNIKYKSALPIPERLKVIAEHTCPNLDSDCARKRMEKKYKRSIIYSRLLLEINSITDPFEKEVKIGQWEKEFSINSTEPEDSEF